MAEIINGKLVAANVREKIKNDVNKLKCEKGVEVGLAVILVGEDAASKVYKGEISLDEIDKSTFEEASELLSKIKGVGPKVASCALLFGFGKTEAFPIDVWIRRALDTHFGGDIDVLALGKSAGIFQQYLFYYERYNQNT